MIPKFRVWDKKYKEIMKVNQINFETRTACLEADNGDHEMRHTLTRSLTDIELMQSTGLKDKNEVEIFEGDVVRSFSNINRVSDPHLTQTIEPTYNNKIVIYSNGAFVLSDDGKREYAGVLNHYAGAMTKDFKVIGNIYENPELLEAE
ncbi:YopX family protein [Enterococcus thailandicus]|uniref:YopX family protein n=1 Tax=Enterococcus thailandicus TaxID=417368 RepID=UPI0035DAB03E